MDEWHVRCPGNSREPKRMFYETAESQWASLAAINRNNHALTDDTSTRRSRRVNIVLLGDEHVDKAGLIKDLVRHLRPTNQCQRRRFNSIAVLYQRTDRSIVQKLHLRFHSIDPADHHENDLISFVHAADCLLFVYNTHRRASFDHLTEHYLPAILHHHTNDRCSYAMIAIDRSTARLRLSKFLVGEFPLTLYRISPASSQEELLHDLLDDYVRRQSSRTRVVDVLHSFRFCSLS